MLRTNANETTKGAAECRPPLWRRPKAASFVLALNKAHALAPNTAHVLRLNNADVLALNTQCSEPTQRKSQRRRAAEGRQPPFVEAAEGRLLCASSEHWAYLIVRRMTCALLKAKTSTLLRRETCAVSRARTCASFIANTKGTLHKYVSACPVPSVVSC